MATQLSPGVNIREVDLTSVVPAVATSTGAFAGIFRWGPVGERVLVNSETNLISLFGKPTSLNPETYYTASSFLNYGNTLYIGRAADTTSYATFSGSINGTTLTVSDIPVGTIMVGQTVFGLGVTAGTVIIGGSGTSWTVNKNQSVSLTPMTSTETVLNALANTDYVANPVSQIVKNSTGYSNGTPFDSNILYIAKYPGAIGNSLRISICDSVNAFSSMIDLQTITKDYSGNLNYITPSFVINAGSNTGSIIFTANIDHTAATNAAYLTANSITIGDLITVGNSTIGTQALSITGQSVTANATASVLSFNFASPYRLKKNWTADTTVNGNNSVVPMNRKWQYASLVSKPPQNSDYMANFGGNTTVIDTMHVVVIDQDGLFTSTPGSVLETFEGISRVTSAKTSTGDSNYYKSVINDNSNYIWWANDRSGASSADVTNVTNSSNITPLTLDLVVGSDGLDEGTIDYSVITTGFDLFASKETSDISLLLQGKPIGGSALVGNYGSINNYALANYLIQNIAEVRNDCVVFITPDDNYVRTNPGAEAVALADWRSNLVDSTYAVLDSGYKYTYDKYNELYRWVPLNGDIAGLCARTDQTNDSWWSPAGYNRGQIKNVIKLRFNPVQTDRDLLYTHSINPVVTFPGQGTILYGDKTMTSKPSAFDRINVRRLFITLEKAIAAVAKYSLFEFNDEFTRAQFRNLINPYLRDVQSRRGITDFLVVCDTTNNTAQVIDSNQFIGDIYIKPARSINFIQLNFVAVPTGVQFSTIVGQF
jgi:hypothetical protein